MPWMRNKHQTPKSKHCRAQYVSASGVFMFGSLLRACSGAVTLMCPCARRNQCARYPCRTTVDAIFGKSLRPVGQEGERDAFLIHVKSKYTFSHHIVQASIRNDSRYIPNASTLKLFIEMGDCWCWKKSNSRKNRNRNYSQQYTTFMYRFYKAR